MAHLIVRIDGEETQVDLTPGDIVSVGRDPGNTIALTDERKASRRHCQITPVKRDGADAFELKDLGATNKTRVNGKAADQKILSHGDVIAVGSTEIEFHDASELERLREAGQKGVCYLEWIAGDKKGERVWLDTPRVTLGRRDSNTIVLTDRMSSGHHAEVTKDLNGYTVRDLGSTNGTLLNGEPITEMVLAHGSRLRVGNSRFMFKDPSMKDIEIELSQVDEDDGWGMMGDIDLSKGGRSKAGLLITLFFLAVAGGGGWFLWQHSQKAAEARGGTVVANEVDNGDMEVDAEFLNWATVRENEDIDVDVTARGRRGQGLSLTHRGEPSARPDTVLYADEIEAISDTPLRLQAAFKRASGDATLVAVWHSGRGAGTHTVPLAHGSGGWERVDVVLPTPYWARALQVGVRMAGGSKVVLDDVVLTYAKTEGPKQTLDAPGGVRAELHPGAGVDLMDSGGTPMALGFQAVAEVGGTLLTAFQVDEVETGALSGHFLPADGEPLPARVSWSTDAEGLKAQVTCDGADAVGLMVGMPRRFLGDRVSALTQEGARTLSPDAGQTLAGVRRLLLGDGRAATTQGLIALGVAREQGGTVHVREAWDDRMTDVAVQVPGTEAVLSITTDFSQQRKEADAALKAATELVRARREPGIRALQAVAVAYPFNEAVADVARKRAARATADSEQEIGAFEDAIDAFEIFQSSDALARVETLQAELIQTFPAPSTREEETGVYAARVAALSSRATERAQIWYSDRADAELTRLRGLATLLETVEGYKPMAALYLRAIQSRWGHLAQDDSPFGRRVAEAIAAYRKLVDQDGVAQALPPAPDRGS